ncbi:MAG TPA: MG2 domain-containing protein [Kofleriaceae bacterium]|nr:MG2 domain-containing protein [Kofleriaceae bacterium]
MLAACSGKTSRLDGIGSNKAAAGHGVYEGSGGSAEEQGPDAPPKLPPVSVKKLQPMIHELGVEHVVPTGVVIELATPIVDKDHVGEVSSRSVFKITPEIAGTLSYTNVSELTFTPARPFQSDTEYKVELDQLETRDGILEPTSGDHWSYAFKTPAFKLVSWAPTALDAAHHKVTMEVAFSAPVLPNIAIAAMAFTIDGHPTTSVTAVPSHTPNVVAVEIGDKRIALGSKLAMSIKAGQVAAITGSRAPAGSVDYVISNDKAISIKAATVVEGASGFYVEVICDDMAAPQGHRAYYEGEGYYNLSQRCLLDDESLSRIHFTPEVKHVYVTNGQAGFRIFGEFKRGAYSLKIDSGATSVDGGVVLAPYAKSFSVSARKPTVTFASSGRYLPRSAWSNLGIKHLNVEAVSLVVRQVPPENLVFWLGNDGSDAADERTSNIILKKTIPLRGDPDVATTTWLDVASMIPATTRGVLELRLVAVGTQATSRLMLTDMSLVAKKSSPTGKPWDQTVQVWALGIESADLLDGVDVSLVRKSGKVVARCSTAGASGCKLEVNADGEPDQSEPFALIARKGDDLTYIRYQDLRADVAESSTSGVPYTAATPYRAAMFSDRGVYRPGDTAHVVAIVRDAKDHAPAITMPIDVSVFDPRAKLARKLTLKPNAAGVIALDQAFPAFADTGHWQVELAVADKPLASYDLQVEEFVPERMKVDVVASKSDVLIGEKVAFDVSAQYLFGGSAIDSGVELTCTIEPERFAPEDNADLTYGVEPKGKPVNIGDAKAQLDPAGKVKIACPDLESATAFTQTGKLTATAAVLEAGSGRATVKTASVMVHPEQFYIGLKTKAEHADVGETFTVEGAIVDWTGKLAPHATDHLQVELVHLESDYGYGYDEDTGEQRYDRWTRPVPDGKLVATVTGGKFSFDVTPGDVGTGYIVRVKAGKARTELELPPAYYDYYYDYGDYGEGRADMTPRPARPTQLALKLPKQIEVGKPVAVTAKSPYRGKVLWTVETDHVIASEWTDATADLSWSFTLDSYAPNVYVSAFVVKDPHLESKDAFLPDRAYGVGSARVIPTEFTQTVKLEAPKEVRSSSPLSIQLAVDKPDPATFAIVSVVDEGILQLTSFQTPDPLSQLFPKAALAVETYETIGWTMLHQPAGASSRTGGGDDGEAEGSGEGGGLAGRVQPVKPVALFSGVVPVGADGKVTIPFQVPQYRGQLRVMAITASSTRIGRAEAEVLVRDPLVVQVTFPRFVAQGDEMQIPVFLTNMSGGPLDVTVKLDSQALPIPGLVMPRTSTAPIAMTGKDTGTVHIDDGHAETVVFAAKATLAAGGAHLRVVASATGRAGPISEKDEVDVPFLPAGPKDRAVQKIKIEPGMTSIDLTKSTALKGWAPTSETTTFWLTSNPYGESFEHLDYLIHYPYGCIEQTTSTTLPLLYVGNIVEQVDPKLAELKIEDMVLSGINRVLSMETPSGGFGYWPGATEPLEWATAYATHMLLEAKKAGYAVPDDRLRDVLAWIGGRLSAYERGERIERDRWSHYDEQSEAYLHYVLALAGKGRKARILKLISTIPASAKGEQAEDRYMLMAALYIAGDRRYEKDLKAVDTSPIAADRINSWSFYSDRRRRALMLSTFYDLFGKDPAGELLAQRVAESLANEWSGYYNTQELVWGVVGLGKWIGASSATSAAGTLVADGVEIAPRRTKHKTPDRTWSLMRASEYKSLTLDLPAGAAGLYLVINSAGVRTGSDYKVGGNGLEISRTYRTIDGGEVDPAKGELKLGDLMFVEIEIGNTSGQTIQNIAVVDRLPAGFEIENPRLGRTTKPDWVKDEEQWTPDFMNLRDDRLEAFGELPPKTARKIVYTVRAVTSGTYALPPAEAEAMYDPSLWARDRGGTAVVGGPWTGKTL